MNLTFAPRGILQIDDARIIYRNFAGAPSKFNREGDRNFAVVIPDEEIANELIKEGWNVKTKPPRDDDDGPFMYLPVKVKFSDRGPNAYLASGNRLNKLDEDSIACLDDVDILWIDEAQAITKPTLDIVIPTIIRKTNSKIIFQKF